MEQKASINKQATLDWLISEQEKLHLEMMRTDDEDDQSYLQVQFRMFQKFRDAIQSGRFDAPSDDRLRAALEQARRCLIVNMPKTALTHIEEALSTTEPEDEIDMMSYAAGWADSKEYHAERTEPTGAERVRDEIMGLLQEWDFRSIAAELESGYERGVVVELVELCEKLVGINAPEEPGPSKSMLGLMTAKEQPRGEGPR